VPDGLSGAARPRWFAAAMIFENAACGAKTTHPVLALAFGLASRQAILQGNDHGAEGLNAWR